MNDSRDDGSTSPAKGGRQAMRRARTRGRLMRAGLELFAVNDAEGVTIQEITQRAGVGFGSFYNHFPSKVAIYEALIDELFNRFGEALRHHLREAPDPAEILAISIRATIRQARKDPLWGQFLVRSGIVTSMFGNGFGSHLHRDLEAGARSGRFTIDDMYGTMIIITGAVFALIISELAVADGGREARHRARLYGRRKGWHEDRVIVRILEDVGLSQSEATDIATRPLPDIAFSMFS